VSSYALGVLADAERVLFEEHLAQGCAPCEAELRLDQTTAGCLLSTVAQDPPADLRQKVLGRARSAPRFPGVLFQEAGLLISRSSEMDWKPLAPGIAFKPLFVDAERRYHTSLVRMDAGAKYPGHRHRDTEEVFMISGDFHVAGQVIGPGDYCRAELDTVHGRTYSESGCVFLLCASELNEVMA
jgi:anti-sigma factor ChrR (cupin superfamily)